MNYPFTEPSGCHNIAANWMSTVCGTDTSRPNGLRNRCCCLLCWKPSIERSRSSHHCSCPSRAIGSWAACALTRPCSHVWVWKLGELEIAEKVFARRKVIVADDGVPSGCTAAQLVRVGAEGYLQYGGV